MSVSESEEDSHSGCAGQEDGVRSTDVLGMVSYQLETLATNDQLLNEDAEEAEWRLNGTKWCANVAECVSRATVSLLILSNRSC